MGIFWKNEAIQVIIFNSSSASLKNWRYHFEKEWSEALTRTKQSKALATLILYYICSTHLQHFLGIENALLRNSYERLLLLSYYKVNFLRRLCERICKRYVSLSKEALFGQQRRRVEAETGESRSGGENEEETKRKRQRSKVEPWRRMKRCLEDSKSQKDNSGFWRLYKGRGIAWTRYCRTGLYDSTFKREPGHCSDNRL